MTELKNKITAPQLFCLVFCYMLAGFRLHGGAGVPATFFVCLFCACVCVACAAVCGECGTFSGLCRSALGKFGFLLRALAAVLLALPFLATLSELAKGAANFYENGRAAAVLPVLILLCVLALSRGFCTIGRFAELCAFPLALLLPLSLLGGGGETPVLALTQEDVPACFAAVGAVPVFFSLYVRAASPCEQSEAARVSAFHPSPVLCGVLGVFAAGGVHLFLVSVGAGSVLSSFLVWFVCLGRLFAFSLCAGDVLGLPESGVEACARKSAVFATVCAAVWLASARFPAFFGAALAVGNVALPCAVFAAQTLGRAYRFKHSERDF